LPPWEAMKPRAWVGIVPESSEGSEERTSFALKGKRAVFILHTNILIESNLPDLSRTRRLQSAFGEHMWVQKLLVNSILSMYR
jgi:hypothetical protein